ncbi:MAG: glutamate 5-kinase [Bacillota bacterium]
MNEKVGFIGAGNMATAIIRGAVASGSLDGSRIMAVNKANKERLERLQRDYGVRAATSLGELVRECSTLVLAVKPGEVPAVLEALVAAACGDALPEAASRATSRREVKPGSLQSDEAHHDRPALRHLLISVAAGVPLSFLEKALGPEFAVLRSMPNTPAQVGEGVTAICAGASVTEHEKSVGERLLASTGKVFWVDEEQLDAVTALSGSGPAYFFKLAEDMASAGTRMGLEPGLAEQLARQTLCGAGHLLKQSPLTLSDLVRQVTSPNGTTAAALKVFEGRHFDRLIEEAMTHAAARSREMAQTPGRHVLTKATRVVVKVGSSTVTDPSGNLNIPVLADLVRQVASLQTAGRQVILVSSGAVAAGRGKIGPGFDDTVTGRQVLSSVGQALLMKTYESLFDEYGLAVAQVLLTRDDFANPKRAAICRNTITELCGRGIVPIVNENDAVAFDEIKLGDNDTLSARVAVLVSAGALVLLTDTDGLFDADPRRVPNATLLRTVDRIDSSITAMAGSTGSSSGTGGMVTKLWAANLAMENGIPTVMGNGSGKDVLLSIVGGKEVGTFFPPEMPHAEVPHADIPHTEISHAEISDRQEANGTAHTL